MPTSSRKFESVLKPDPKLRAWVLACACLFAFAGAVILLRLPLPAYLIGVLELLWLLDCVREILALRRGATRLRELRLTAGGIATAVTPQGQERQLTLLAGSVVFRRLAWIRMRFPDGREHAELLRGDGRQDRQWHRLQLIWRQRRGVFGRQDGS